MKKIKYVGVKAGPVTYREEDRPEDFCVRCEELKAQRQKDHAFCRGLIEGIKTIPTTATASNWSDYAAKVGYTNREHNKRIDQALTALAEHFGEK